MTEAVELCGVMQANIRPLIARRHIIYDDRVHLGAGLSNDFPYAQAHCAMRHIEPVLYWPNYMIAIVKGFVKIGAVSRSVILWVLPISDSSRRNSGSYIFKLAGNRCSQSLASFQTRLLLTKAVKALTTLSISSTKFKSVGRTA